jgi:nucleotide-binding universal stress UspA family protein
MGKLRSDMYEILLPISRAEAGARRQAEMIMEMPIALDEVSVTVLHADETITSEVGGTVSPAQTEEVPESVRATIDVLEDAGIDVDAVVAEGNLADTVHSLVDERDADHVVVAGRRRSPTGKALFGSDIQSIILNATVPITVTPDPDET